MGKAMLAMMSGGKGGGWGDDAWGAAEDNFASGGKGKFGKGGKERDGPYGGKSVGKTEKGDGPYGGKSGGKTEKGALKGLGKKGGKDKGPWGQFPKEQKIWIGGIANGLTIEELKEH